MPLFAGIDVGGTNLRIGVVENTRLIYQKRFHTDFSQLCRMHAPEAAWPLIVEAVAHPLGKVLQLFPDVVSIGIGFPGFIDPVNGTVLQSPNLPGLYRVDLAGDLSAHIGRPVIVENDAMAAAYGEYRLCKGTVPSLVYIGLGTGVGGGLTYEGRPFTGQHGTAMEIGHIIVEHSDAARPCGCGNHGCLEQYASASGVALSYKLATGSDLDAVKVAELAKAGDMHALAAFSLAGTCLAQAVAHLSKILDVGQIVIGGGLSNSWSFMQQAFNAQLQADLIPVLRNNLHVRISASSDEAGIIGAALLSDL
jgi:glucokinase